MKKPELKQLIRKEVVKLLEDHNIEIIESENAWICTDPDCGQYGRQIAKGVFEFQQEGVQAEIDLADYTLEEKMHYVKAYGYTLSQLYEENPKDDADWLVAECIFETDFFEF
jgi:hypothetical protein